MAKIKEIKVENVAAAIMMIKEYQERVSALKGNYTQLHAIMNKRG